MKAVQKEMTQKHLAASMEGTAALRLGGALRPGLATSAGCSPVTCCAAAAVVLGWAGVDGRREGAG